MRTEFLDWRRKAWEKEGHLLIFEELKQVNGGLYTCSVLFWVCRDGKNNILN